MVEVLLRDPRVHPAARDNEAMHLVAIRGHLPAVEVLLADDRVHAALDSAILTPRGRPAPSGGALECLLAQPRALAGAARIDLPAEALGRIARPRLAARIASNAWARRRAAVVAWAAARAAADEEGGGEVA